MLPKATKFIKDAWFISVLKHIRRVARPVFQKFSMVISKNFIISTAKAPDLERSRGKYPPDFDGTGGIIVVNR